MFMDEIFDLFDLIDVKICIMSVVGFGITDGYDKSLFFIFSNTLLA